MVTLAPRGNLDKVLCGRLQDNRSASQTTRQRTVILTKQVAAGAGVLALSVAIFMGGDAVARDYTKEDSNKALVQASFDRLKNATGGPFELLAPDAQWTIVGSSPV
jgi:hypothetical protein